MEDEELARTEIAVSESGIDLDAAARILEALLLAADGPLSLDALQKLVGAEFNLGRKELREALGRLAARFENSAAELHEVAGGWRLQVRAQFGEWVARLWQDKPPKYSRAALETLALVVYRQPITRGEIEDIRGVAVSTNILRTLLERGWVREVGVKESPGRPALYGTTAQFLDDFNLKSLDQLPSLPDVKDLEQLEAAMQRIGLEVSTHSVNETDEVDISTVEMDKLSGKVDGSTGEVDRSTPAPESIHSDDEEVMDRSTP